jgi:hypothetical protein
MARSGECCTLTMPGGEAVLAGLTPAGVEEIAASKRHIGLKARRDGAAERARGDDRRGRVRDAAERELIVRSHDVGTRRVTWPLAGKAAMMSRAIGRPPGRAFPALTSDGAGRPLRQDE